MKTPSADEVRRARVSAELTQREAAECVHMTVRGWQHYEQGLRKMHPAVWELFNLKVSGEVPYRKEPASWE